jgi:hypothetical protein
MTRKTWFLLAALALPLSGAGDAALDRATLRGVTAVHVVMDPVAPELERAGATANVLRSRLEERLRRAGVSIDPASTAFVALRLTSVRASRGPFAIAADIGLYQPVILSRDRNLRTATQTWEVETVILAEPKQVEEACTDSVDDLAGRFVTAYRSVNTTADKEDPGPKK